MRLESPAVSTSCGLQTRCGWASPQPWSALAAAAAGFIISVVFVAKLAGAELELPLWVEIDWKLGPDLPEAFQDSDGGIINNVLVTTCGYCDSRDTAPPSKKEKSGMGQNKKTWGVPLDDPSKDWQALPDY